MNVHDTSTNTIVSCTEWDSGDICMVDRDGHECRIANPLGLPVVWTSDLEAPHEVRSEQKLARLTDAMREAWIGPPIIANGALCETGQGRAYTGTHRIVAAAAIGEHEHGVARPVPFIAIEDLAEHFGADWDAILDQANNNDLAAAVVVFGHASLEVQKAYGLDLEA